MIDRPTPAPLPADLFERPECEGGPVPFRVGDKWTGVVLRCLEDGPRRFSELRVPLHWITPKVLTETLRAMERDGFLTRTVYDENPPRVEYELTLLGRSLIAPLDATCEWSRTHLTQVAQAREEYTARWAGGWERRSARPGPRVPGLPEQS